MAAPSIRVVLASLFVVALLSACGGAAGSSGDASPAVARVAAPAADLSGDWVLTVETPNGTGTRNVTFEQEGGALSGTISSSMAAGPLVGSIVGDQVSFVATVSMSSGDFDIVYEATLRDGRLVDGIVDLGAYGSGTFTGERR